MPEITRSSALLALSLTALVAAPAHAADPPPAENVTIEYSVTAPDGTPVRRMDDADRTGFVNRARCECGQQISARIRMTTDDLSLSQATQIDAMVGNACDVSENDPVGQFRRCGVLKSSPLTDYVKGVEVGFHPAFLAHGVAPSSVSRAVDDPETVLAGGCDGFGEGGVWMCAQVNGISGCQDDEFFLGGQLAGGLAPMIKFDFVPPIAMLTDLTVESGNGSVMLSWDIVTLGDIAGYRVLCEEAATGAPAAGVAVAAPEPNASPSEEHYFNAHNLCGDDPFTSVMFTDPDDPGAGVCGDGRLDTGEQCDDGYDNADDGLCSTACELRVGEALHALDWDHLCSGHVAYDDTSVAIGGLENGKTYNFVLVTHDLFGNPRALARVVQATPDADAPSFVPEAEDGCGCRSTEGHVPGAMLSLALLGLLRRRRR